MSVLALQEKIAAQLPAEKGRKLSALALWDLSSVRRRVQGRKRWTAKRAREIEDEYKKFIALVVINPKRLYGMAGAVDEFWHEHIMHTKDYFRMCQAIGAGYIHHSPETSTGASSISAKAYKENTLNDLASHFLEFNKRLWPRARSKCNNCNDSA